jgi:hypothetical protein
VNDKDEMPIDLRGRMFEIGHQESQASTLAGKIKYLARLVREEDISSTRTNLIAKYGQEAMDIGKRLSPTIIENTLGELSIEAIGSLIRESEETREERLEWVHFHLLPEELKVKKDWNKRRAKLLQEMYADEPKRCFRWVANDTQPELKIPIHDIQKHFTERWEDPVEFVDNNQWNLLFSLNKEQEETLTEELISVE